MATTGTNKGGMWLWCG